MPVRSLLSLTPDEALDYARTLASSQGLSISLTSEGGVWSVDLTSGGSVVWSDQGFDKLVLCLNVIGWIQRDVEIQHPEWTRNRAELCHRISLPKRAEKDPPDLDPKEVAAVYGLGPKPTL